VVGVIIAPAVAAAVVGGGFGALIGNVVDQWRGLKDTTTLVEAERLIDESTANLIAIADQSTAAEIAEAALRRERRLVAEIDSANTESLERELQREGWSWGY
jgi:hypothetical protein